MITYEFGWNRDGFLEIFVCEDGLAGRDFAQKRNLHYSCIVFRWRDQLDCSRAFLSGFDVTFFLESLYVIVSTLDRD